MKYITIGMIQSGTIDFTLNTLGIRKSSKGVHANIEILKLEYMIFCTSSAGMANVKLEFSRLFSFTSAASFAKMLNSILLLMYLCITLRQLAVITQEESFRPCSFASPSLDGFAFSSCFYVIAYT